MAAMSRNNSIGSAQGFSVCQPTLGAALQFYPALGTQQLDDLINAYLPGSATLKEKRATISMDFCEFSQQTGESFKYYPVYAASFHSAVDSSASSSPMMDSNFVSPVISDWSWSQSTPASASVSTPSSSVYDLNSSRVNGKASRSANSSGSRPQAHDFSHLPGMKIMTKDGQDVTNSASRGCKTKEQRDHAHLMRIIKACDACRRKKIRCDPSHKKRTASQPQSQPQAKSAKKARQSHREPRIAVETVNLSITTPSLTLDPAFADAEIQDITSFSQEPWEAFVQYDDEPMNIMPFDYDFFFDPERHISPESGVSSTSPSQPLTPARPAEASSSLYNDWSYSQLPEDPQPSLPYLDRSGPATNYIDFNLYSPASSFLDEDMVSSTDIGSSARGEQIATSGVLSVNLHQQSQSRYSSLERHLVDSRLSSSVDTAGGNSGVPVLPSQYPSSPPDAVDWGWSDNTNNFGEIGRADRSRVLTSNEPHSASVAVVAATENQHDQSYYAQSTSAHTQMPLTDSPNLAVQTYPALSTTASCRGTQGQLSTHRSVLEPTTAAMQVDSPSASGTGVLASLITSTSLPFREAILHSSGDTRYVRGSQDSSSLRLGLQIVSPSVSHRGQDSDHSLHHASPVLAVRSGDCHRDAVDHTMPGLVQQLTVDECSLYSSRAPPGTLSSTTTNLLALSAVVGMHLLQTFYKESWRSGVAVMSPWFLLCVITLTALSIVSSLGFGTSMELGGLDRLVQVLLGLTLYSGYHMNTDVPKSRKGDSLTSDMKTSAQVIESTQLTKLVGSIKFKLHHCGQQVDNIRCQALHHLRSDSESSHEPHASRQLPSMHGPLLW